MVITIFILYIGYLIFFSIKKKQFEKNKFIQLCPKCGSSNKQMSGLWTAPYVPAKYKCPDCRYEGIFVEVDEDKISEFKSKFRKEK